MTIKFKKATRKAAKARIALMGPSGSGKTWTGISMLRGLVGEGGRIAVIDTERGSASLYSDITDFDVVELDSFEPEAYVDAMKVAAAEGYGGVLIDSLSHAWMGKGGALEKVEDARVKSRSQNSFTAWREVTPLHNQLVDTMLWYPGHLIATMRVKTHYDMQEDDRGKKTPVRIGLAPVQRDGVEYEFTACGDIDLEHRLTFSKSRVPMLAGKLFRDPGRDVGQIIKTWLESGVSEFEATIQLLAIATPQLAMNARSEARRIYKTLSVDEQERLKDAVAALEERLSGGGTVETQEENAA